MPWQKIDDQFGISQKVIRIPRRRRQQCIGLWTLAGNYAVRALTDGIVEAHELEELDAREGDIDELVRVALWHYADHSCPTCQQPPAGGVVIHDFLAYNKSREQVAAERGAARDRMRRNRGTGGGDPNIGGSSDPNTGGSSDGVRANTERSAAEVPAEFDNPVPSRPVPSRSDGLDMTDELEIRPDGDVAHVRTDQVITDVVKQKAARAGIQDLPRLHGLLARAVRPIGPLSAMAAVTLVEAITNRARGEVKDVDAYVITTARNPLDVQSLYASEDLEFMSRQESSTDRSIA